MLNKKVLVLVIFIVSLLTISAVSAADNITNDNLIKEDVLKSDNPNPVSQQNENVLEIGSKDPQMNVTFPEEVIYEQDTNIVVELPDDAFGEVYVFVDCYEQVYDTDAGGYDPGDTLSFSIGEMGVHDVTVVYSGDAIYKKSVHTRSYNVSDYNIPVYLVDGDTLQIELPYDASGNVSVTCNGKTKKINIKYYSTLELQLDDDSDNYNVTVEYSGDGVFKQKTVKKILYREPIFSIPETIGITDDNFVEVEYFKDVDATLYLSVENVNFTSTVLVDGKAQCRLPYLDFGSYDINLTLIRQDNISFSRTETVEVIPKIVGNKMVYSKDNASFSFEFPQDYDKNLSIYVSKTLWDMPYVYNRPIVEFNKPLENGKTDVSLPNLKTGTYEVRLDYDNRNYTHNFYFEISGENPNIQNSSSSVSALPDSYVYLQNFKTGYDGEIICLIDGKDQIKGEFVFSEESATVSLKGLSLGKHNIEAKFVNDSYYNDFTKNITVDIQNIVISCDESRVSIDVVENVTGKVTVYIDGKKYESIMLYDWGNNVYYDLDVGNHTILVKYEGNYPKFNKKFNICVNPGVDYISLVSDDIVYGSIDKLYIYAPGDLEKVFKVSIDGKNYPVVNDRVDISKLSIGDHTVTLSYSGDKNYLPLSKTETLRIYPYIVEQDAYDVSLKLPKNAEGSLDVYANSKYVCTYPLSKGFAYFTLDSINETNLKLGDNVIVVKYNGNDFNVTPLKTVVQRYLKIPNEITVGQEVNIIVRQNTTDNITVTIGNHTISHAFVDGIAVIQIPTDLNVGYYDVKVKCGDYETNDSLTVLPKFYITPVLIEGKGVFEVEVPNNTTGMVKLNIDGADGEMEYLIDIFNGKAKINLSGIDFGKECNVHITYRDINKFYYHDYCHFNIKVKLSSIVSSSLTMNYNDGSTFNVRVLDAYGKSVKYGYVTFYIDGKKVKTVKTDKNGCAVLKIDLPPKTYAIITAYKNIKVTNKITVKHLLALKSGTVKKSAKKLVLTAILKKVNGKYLKGKKITFKFNGKTYTAKTDKKGVAKVTVKSSVLKKLKVGKKVTYQATYLKDTVKKTVVVKK